MPERRPTSAAVAPPRRVGIPATTADRQAQKLHAPLANQSFAPLPAPTGAPPFRLATGALGLAVARAPRAAPRRRHRRRQGPQPPDPRRRGDDRRPRAERRRRSSTTSATSSTSTATSASTAPSSTSPTRTTRRRSSRSRATTTATTPTIRRSPSLAAFVENFCSPDAAPRPAGAGDQPRHDGPAERLLDATDALFTIVGLYTNVPEGGVVAQDQVDWLVEELRAAPARLRADRRAPPPAVLVRRRPRRLGGDGTDARRRVRRRAAARPDIVLTGHVHDYQRFTRTIGRRRGPLHRRRRRRLPQPSRDGSRSRRRPARGAVPGRAGLRARGLLRRSNGASCASRSAAGDDRRRVHRGRTRRHRDPRQGQLHARPAVPTASPEGRQDGGTTERRDEDGADWRSGKRPATRTAGTCCSAPTSARRRCRRRRPSSGTRRCSRRRAGGCSATTSGATAPGPAPPTRRCC